MRQRRSTQTWFWQAVTDGRWTSVVALIASFIVWRNGDITCPQLARMPLTTLFNVWGNGDTTCPQLVRMCLGVVLYLATEVRIKCLGLLLLLRLYCLRCRLRMLTHTFSIKFVASTKAAFSGRRMINTDELSLRQRRSTQCWFWQGVTDGRWTSVIAFVTFFLVWGNGDITCR